MLIKMYLLLFIPRLVELQQVNKRSRLLRQSIPLLEICIGPATTVASYWWMLVSFRERKFLALATVSSLI